MSTLLKIDLISDEELKKVGQNFNNNWDEEYNNKLNEYKNKNWFGRLFSYEPEKRDIKYNLNMNN